MSSQNRASAWAAQQPDDPRARGGGSAFLADRAMAPQQQQQQQQQQLQQQPLQQQQLHGLENLATKIPLGRQEPTSGPTAFPGAYQAANPTLSSTSYSTAATNVNVNGTTSAQLPYNEQQQQHPWRSSKTIGNPQQAFSPSAASLQSPQLNTESANKQRAETTEADLITTEGASSSDITRRVRFKSLLAPAVINESDDETSTTNSANNLENRHTSANPTPRLVVVQKSTPTTRSGGGQELIDLTSLQSDTSRSDARVGGANQNNRRKQHNHHHKVRHVNLLSETIPEEESTSNQDQSDSDLEKESSNFFDDDEDDQNNSGHDDDEDDEERHYEVSDFSPSPSHHKLKGRNNTLAGRLYRQVKNLGSDLQDRLGLAGAGSTSTISYTAYAEQDSQVGSSSSSLAGGVSRKYRKITTKGPGRDRKSPEQNFRGSYRYSRIGILMTVFKKLLGFLVQRSTLALFGAFLIHVTLGTIYTLSNINSYLTSYMRKHGTPGATYGGSMWISSSYAVGQGLSMILGGLIERRFSARVACILGCFLHSMSVMSTAKSIDYGHLAVLLTYGFLPGFGCGLAYMTPMSNGFGWFPHRKGLVAGVILAGFGIGTFVFNMAQTAYVNPQNLSPPPNSGGYFTQDEILDNVPHLFTFLGTIYACMQFIGCCLLFKPPSPSGYASSKGSLTSLDERPIIGVESEIPFKRAIRTREFIVLFLVFGVTNQGVLFVNSMLKEYGQIFIADDLYLAWTGSMASIANSLGRLVWGMAIDRYSFTICFTAITTIFGTLMFLMPFEFILSSKLLYLICTLGIFGSFSGWMSTYPVHLSRIFGLKNSGMIYGLIFVSQSIGGIMTAFAAHYLIDHYSRFVPFFCVTLLEVLGLALYHLFYNNK